MSTPQPKLPSPQQVSTLLNKQVTQAVDLANAQASEVATTLGLPSPPPMPKIALPTLPGAPGGQQLPFIPFPLTTPRAPTTKVGAPPSTEKKEVSTEGKILA